MKPDDPRHGTRAQPQWQTVPGCPCDTCEASRAHRRRLYKQAQMGRPARIPTDLAKRHISKLMAAGWRQNDIARASGVGQATISEILTGKAKQVSVDNAAAIIGVTGPANPAHVPSHGTIRRAQALVAIGWLAKEVTAEAGLAEQFLSDLLSKNQATVTATSAAAIADVYERLSMTIPEMTPRRKRGRTLAAKKGWLPPLAWDDIDDPDENPAAIKHVPRRHTDIDPVRVDKLLAGDREIDSTRAEKCEAMRRWLAAGNTERSLCVKHNWHEGRYTPRDEDAA